MNIAEYRKDKDNIEFIEQFKEDFPQYFDFVDSTHRKFYGYDKDIMTMGCSYAIYRNLVRDILHNRPKHIIEYGPGFTTLLFLKVFEDLDYTPEFYSYENDPSFYKILSENGFNPDGIISLVDMKVEVSDEIHFCTYLHDLQKHKDVDYIFIDGPGNVNVDGKVRPNINLNLKELSELGGGKRINYLIDGRSHTRKFYKNYFSK